VSSAINTFQNPSEAKSAHYIVGDEGRVVQCVRHEDVAWHAGDWPTNRRSIGIEHGGWASEPETWTREKVRASARLAAYCCRRHKIRVDSKHIILHRNVPGVTKTCPGPTSRTRDTRSWSAATNKLTDTNFAVFRPPRVSRPTGLPAGFPVPRA
jgi:N-acetyl-anhydromuramyl-L-alanine amidase AmpD